MQNEVNELAAKLRMQVIEYLYVEDQIKFSGKTPTREDIDLFKRFVNNIRCVTGSLKELFADAHEMHDAKGMFPHPVTIGDLEWCLKNRHIGYFQKRKAPWLPYREDRELRSLPAFKALAVVYRPLIEEGKPLIAPTQQTMQQDVKEIVMSIANNQRKD